MKLPVKLLVAVILFCSSASAQDSLHLYRRELTGVTASWHTITLPADIFSRSRNNLGDLRIYNFTPKGDTLEVPYLLRLRRETVLQKKIGSRIINRSFTPEGHHFTIQPDEAELINEIVLNFENENFDWTIKIMGSQDLEEKVTIAENYRILSLKNENTNFRYTTLNIPASKFRYYHLTIPSPEKPGLVDAQASHIEKLNGLYFDYEQKQWVVSHSGEEKTSFVDITLPEQSYSSSASMLVADTIDYYRPIEIAVLVDSIRTDERWRYRYRTVASGALSSSGRNIIDFPGVIGNRFRITVYNADNRPLSINDINLRGTLHELVARFSGNGQHYLYYGGKSFGRPDYDIAKFTDKVPATPAALTVGTREELFKQSGAFASATDKRWILWLVMAGLIAVLAYFSMRMMRARA